MKRTEIAALGEFGLINHLAEGFKKFNRPESKLGIGDDAAAMDFGGEHFVLLSTDTLVEGIHFDLSYTPLKHLGYKAVVVNLSDIAAMNGFPTQITVSLSLSNRFSVEAIEELYAGIALACETYKIDLVGGDTTASASGLIISVSVIGLVKKDNIAKRSGAKAGDIVCVSGDLGGAFAGLQLLAREKKAFEADPNMEPEIAEEFAYPVQRQLKPEARTDLVHEFLDVKLVPTAMIDISDGLASECLHLCKSSGVGIQIFEDKLPCDGATKLICSEFGVSSVTAMLNGGEDYELLFSIAQQDFEKIKNNPEITPIGIIKNAEFGAKLHLNAGHLIDITAQGWTHF